MRFDDFAFSRSGFVRSTRSERFLRFSARAASAAAAAARARQHKYAAMPATSITNAPATAAPITTVGLVEVADAAVTAGMHAADEVEPAGLVLPDAHAEHWADAPPRE